MFAVEDGGAAGFAQGDRQIAGGIEPCVGSQLGPETLGQAVQHTGGADQQPALTGQVMAALRMLTAVRIMTVGPGLKSGLKLRLDQPSQLGGELLCGVVAAMAEGPAPMAVIFSDTALTIMGVNSQKELVGGVILPGPQLSMASLVQNTAQLPQVDLTAPAPASVLGKNTSACLQGGLLLGTACMLDGLADRFRAELGPETRFYATGNLPANLRKACRTPILYRENLVSDGLYRIWLRNRKG